MEYKFLEELGIEDSNNGAFCGSKWLTTDGDRLISINPTNGLRIATVFKANKENYERVATEAVKAFESWREVPAPKRGEIIRQLGNELRKYKNQLGALVSLEMGKILAEGKGEVQEMIDICDFAVGLSRQLYGLSMHSERPNHRMYEQWHPLGPVGVISAFNFPAAVWAWNAAIAVVCGDPVIWKPSSQMPLCAIAVQNICNKVMERNGLEGIFNLVIGSGETIGERLIADKRIPLISATGSCKMGHRIADVVGKRLGRTILELGGNNAIIVMDDANLELALRAIVFGAVGTAGQRCTTTRRVLMQKKVANKLTHLLIGAYKQVRIGNPLYPKTLMGPLVNLKAVDDMMSALEEIKKQGGEIIYGGKWIDRDGFFVEPTLVLANKNMPITKVETFAPILYLIEFDTLEEAIAINNDVPQGLSSAIFTTNLISAETFLSHRGSDCGIANVNIGTSGAEIGGAFGGEKETGGGREAGSDAWKQYMCQQTNTINYSTELPLAQGIEFKV